MPGGEEMLWNGECGAGGVSWADRSRMGLLRGVIDAADHNGQRNAYMHALHTIVIERELRRAGPIERALDFGCGTGRFLKTLRRYGAIVYGADREPAMVDAARAYAYAFADWIECSENDEIPFADGIFDFVLCSSVLCVTAPRLIDPSLREMARVARSGATLVLLEQIALTRGLTLRRYFNALARAGFDPLRIYPVRAAGSRFTRLMARHRWIPAWSYGLFARVELTATARNPRTARRDPYIEYAIVARRR